MNEVSELFYKKRSDGRWEVKDRAGHVATGLTKEMAKNQYFALYQLKQPDLLDPSKILGQFHGALK